MHERVSSLSHIRAFHATAAAAGVQVFLAVVGVAAHSVYELGLGDPDAP